VIGGPMQQEMERRHLEWWLGLCFDREPIALECYRRPRGYSGCEVVACQFEGKVVLFKRYIPEFWDYARLGSVDTARKNALVLEEFPALGVPTPRLLAFTILDDEAALVMEWMWSEPLTPAGRLEAARILARLHSISLGDLSPELADLIARSTPDHQCDVQPPGEPPPFAPTIYHGDYGPLNLAARGDSVTVLDWDFLALGDPMWDLACLLEKGVRPEERGPLDDEAVTRAYQEVRPIDAARLAWQAACFEAELEAEGEDR
jgi:aminoglycoside phosphotransferase (APT) family kinase protein